MKEILSKRNNNLDLHIFGKICRELRSSIVGGFARDSATLKLSDVCEIYHVDEDMARSVIDKLVSEHYLSHRHGNRRYTIEYNVEELKLLGNRRKTLESEALTICLSQLNEPVYDQQLKYKKLLLDYQSNNDMSVANLAYICSPFRALNRTKFEEIQFVMRGHSKYLRLYWSSYSNVSIYLDDLKRFNDSCVKLDSASAGKCMEQIIGKVERYVETILDDRETSELRRYDQPGIVGTSGAGRRIIRRKDG